MKFSELPQELQELWTRGVDHSVFNEDWARMGGVVKFKGEPHSKYFKYIFTDNYKSAFCPCDMLHKEIYGLLCVEKIDYRFRMATPEECEASGIDYVPFMGWRDIESVPNDVDVFLDVDEYNGIVGKKESQNFYSEQVKSPCGYHYELKAKRWMPLPLV